MRYEKCRECGVKWNVSKYTNLPRGGYICPKCRIKKAPGTAIPKGAQKINHLNDSRE